MSGRLFAKDRPNVDTLLATMQQIMDGMAEYCDVCKRNLDEITRRITEAEQIPEVDINDLPPGSSRR